MSMFWLDEIQGSEPKTLAEEVEDAMETFRRRAQPSSPLDPPILGMRELHGKPTTTFGETHEH